MGGGSGSPGPGKLERPGQPTTAAAPGPTSFPLGHIGDSEGKLPLAAGQPQALEGAEARVARKTYKCLLPLHLRRRKGTEPISVLGLIDSGNCWRTAISPQLAQQLGYSQEQYQPLEEDVKLCTADENQSLRVLGELPKPIRFTTQQGQMSWALRPVVIQGLAGGLNIGGPLMATMGWSLDVGRSEVITEGGQRLALRPSQERNMQLSQIRQKSLSDEEVAKLQVDNGAKVRMAATVTVPARSTKLVPLLADLKTRGWRGTTREAQLLGSAKFMDETDLHPARKAVVRFDKEGRTWAAVQNTLYKPVKLRAGMEYGVAELVTVPSEVPAEAAKKRRAQLKEEMSNSKFGKYTPDQQREFLVRCFRLDKSPFLRKSTELWKAAEFLRQYWPDFAWDGSYGTTPLLEHHIELKQGARPIKCRYRPLPKGLEDSCRQQVREWLKADVIEPSNSPWSSNLLAVRKKSGETRWCVDWRQLNDLTVKDSYPMPQTTDCLSRLAGSKVFSTLDMSGAFHCIPLTEDSKQYTAFPTPEGLYQFKKRKL